MIQIPRPGAGSGPCAPSSGTRPNGRVIRVTVTAFSLARCRAACSEMSPNPRRSCRCASTAPSSIPGTVHAPGLQPVLADLIRGDLAGMLDLDRPGLAQRHGQRHSRPSRPPRKGVHQHRVHVGAGVHPHGQVGDVAVVASTRSITRSSTIGGYRRPVRHAMLTVTDTSIQSVISGITTALRAIVRVRRHTDACRAGPGQDAQGRGTRMRECLSQATAGDRADRRPAWMPDDTGRLARMLLAPPGRCRHGVSRPATVQPRPPRS